MPRVRTLADKCERILNNAAAEITPTSTTEEKLDLLTEAVADILAQIHAAN